MILRAESEYVADGMGDKLRAYVMGNGVAHLILVPPKACVHVRSHSKVRELFSPTYKSLSQPTSQSLTAHLPTVGSVLIS
jgi:hypothetical protein